VKRLRGPAVVLALGLSLLLLALVLDNGGERSRDAALVVGSLALYAVIPAAVVWLLVAWVLGMLRRRR
jgi:hypothetical protein